jgi:cell division protein FtsB
MPQPPDTPLTPIDTPRRQKTPEPLRRRRVQPPPKAPRWRRALNALLVFVIVVLAVDALVGEKGLTQALRARRESRALAASVQRLRAENAALRERARRLREDSAAIESVAREDLGLIRPGEMLVVVKDVKRAAAR